MDMKYLDYKDGIYYQFFRGVKLPMKPQPDKEKVLILRRSYCVLKANPSYKKRTTMAMQLPSNMGTPKYDVYIAEYVGTMGGVQPQPHGTTKIGKLL